MKQDNLDEVIQSYKNFNSQTIADWVKSQQLATKSYLNPKPQKQGLIDVFDKIMLDPHLTSVLQQRTSKVLGEGFEIVKADGAVDEKLTALVKKNWLQQFMLGAMHSRYYGYTLIEIDDINNDGEITGLKEIDRRNVIPELNCVLKRTWDYTDTIDIADNDDSDYLYLIRDASNDLGLLNKAVPSVLRKLYMETSWLQHGQVAALPLLFGKMADPSPEKVAELTAQLLMMGRGGVGVGGAGDSVEVINRNGSGHALYKEMVDHADSQLTKLVLLQTGTTEANSSYSQSRTHKTVADELAEEDKAYCTNAFNGFIPQLVRLGYPLAGCIGRFTADTTADPEKMKMVLELAKLYDIDEDEILKHTGIVVTQKLTKNKPTE